MTNLIAYIPTVNQRHLDWFKKHPRSTLWLIDQKLAERLLPRLSRNMATVPTSTMTLMLSSIIVDGVRTVYYFDTSFEGWKNNIFMPDEDISHMLHEKYFPELKVEFELIWARYDMTAVHRQSPVVPDFTTSSSCLDFVRMDIARKVGSKSPDWWRQIGAVVFRGDECLALSCNTHLPNEYITYIMGDPRINVDAGQPGKYVSIHAEKAIVALCAADGKALRGASLYVTTFPCEVCSREIGLAGIKKLFFEEGYSTLDAQEVLREFDVEIIRVIKDPVG